jgi:FLVCR family feline leukemia virus subgroup C receptor-related protein
MIFPASNDEQNTNTQTNSSPTARVYQVYPRRFAILAIFCLCSLSSGFQWIEYAIIQNIIVRYYNQSLPESDDAKNNAVTWTSLSYMVIQYIFLY